MIKGRNKLKIFSRLFRAYGKKNYNYTIGRLILCQQEDENTPRFYNDLVKPKWRYLAGASSSDKVISMEADLSPGKYRILVIMDW